MRGNLWATAVGIALVTSMAVQAATTSSEAASSSFPLSLELRPPPTVEAGHVATYELIIRSRVRARGKGMLIVANVFSGTFVGASATLRFAKGHGKALAYIDVPPLAPLAERRIRLSVLPSSTAFSLNIGSIPSGAEYFRDYASVASGPNTSVFGPFRISVEIQGPSHFTAHRPCAFRTLVRNVGATTVEGVFVSIAPINPVTQKLVPFTTPWKDLVRTPSQVFARVPPLPPGGTIPLSVRFIAPAVNRKILGHTYYVTARTTTDGQPSPYVNASLTITPAQARQGG